MAFNKFESHCKKSLLFSFLSIALISSGEESEFGAGESL